MWRVQTLLVLALLAGLSYSWEIALTAGDRIEFYNDDGNKTESVRFPSKKLFAIAYDEVHNMLLYVDKQKDNDTICGYNMTSVEYKCYIERNGRNIQGLAFDPVTELLFFTDTKERSINWLSFKPESKNNIYGNLLFKLNDGIPTDLAVDSCRGYIYWINTNLATSTIEKARFNGLDREIVIEATNDRDLHSLAIDQQTQKICWGEPIAHLRRSIYCADLNGNNKELFVNFRSSKPNRIWTYDGPNSYTVSKKFLYAASLCISCDTKKVWKHHVPERQRDDTIPIFEVPTTSIGGIVANYKMKDQFQGISDCNHVFNNFETEDSFKVAREYDEQFCVHGVKEIGQAVCKCTPGYIGVRCEVSVCENYCLQGNCDFTEEGLPECRCNTGYSGVRCEVNMCNGYCLNGGTCSLNEEDEPVCECVGGYEGGRCELPANLNSGDGSLNGRLRNLTLADLLENWRKNV